MTRSHTPEEWLTVRRAGKVVEVHPSTIRHWAKRDQVRTRQEGANRLYSMSDVRREAEARRMVSDGSVEAASWLIEALRRAEATTDQERERADEERARADEERERTEAMERRVGELIDEIGAVEKRAELDARERAQAEADLATLQAQHDGLMTLASSMMPWYRRKRWERAIGSD